MAASKRASMREGPLAALFRKTEEDGRGAAAHREGAAPEAARAKRARRAGARRASAREPDQPPAEPIDGARRGEPVSSAAPERIEEPATHPRSPRRRSACAPRSARSSPRTDGAPAAATCRGAWRTTAVDVFAREPRRVPRCRAQPSSPCRVVGVGGAGVNAVNRMVEAGVAGVEFIAVNTDLQSLQQSTADVTVHIGAEVTRGLGSGADAELGRIAAMEEYDSIKSLLKGSDMVFITAGAGGGTGTGAAPVIARIAREVGALTVGS